MPQLVLLWTSSQPLPFDNAPDAKDPVASGLVMTVLGVSLAMRDLKSAWEDIERQHDYMIQLKVAWLVIGACEVWIIASGQLAMLVLLYRERTVSNSAVERGRDQVDERAALLAST